VTASKFSEPFFGREPAYSFVENAGWDGDVFRKLIAVQSSVFGRPGLNQETATVLKGFLFGVFHVL
jgi:hypothetical protein